MTSFSQLKTSHPSTITMFLCLSLMSSFLSLQAAEHIRFAPDRVISVRTCDQHVMVGTQCISIRQYNESGDLAKPYHLLSDGLKVNDVAVNANNEVVLVGSFTGPMTLGARIIQSQARWDAFYLIIDSSGKIASFDRLGGRGNDTFYAVTADGAGAFTIDGAMSTLGGETLYYRWTSSVDGTIISRYLYSVRRDDRPISEFTVEDDDPIEDPIG